MPKRLVITGGTGYVGSRIAAYLHKIWPKVPIILPTRNPEILREIDDFKSKHIQILEIKDLYDIGDIFRRDDVVLHFAALNNDECNRNARLAYEVNTGQSIFLIEKAIHCRVDKFIYFSTIHVYGNNYLKTITEKTNPSPTSVYALTHFCAENFLTHAHSKKIITGCVIRLSNVVGAPLHNKINSWNLLTNQLCKELAVSGSITLNTLGNQFRDFISMTNVEKAIEHIINVDPINLGDGIFNLASGTSHTIREITKILENIYIHDKKKSPIMNIPNAININTVHESLREKKIISNKKLIKTGFKLEKNELKKSLEEAYNFCMAKYGK